MIRLNADGPRLRPRSGEVLPCFRTASAGPGPIIVMIHGYKYLPGHPDHCPHHKILSMHPNVSCVKMQSWPRRLGFGAGHTDEGLGLAFGWNARGALWTARRSAVAAGAALAEAIAQLHRHNPRRPLHILSHSMGTEVALEALRQLPPGSVQRILSMTGACYASRAQSALASPAGQQADFINVVSRENDAFDFLYERILAPPTRGDRSIGQGLTADNAVTIQIDCPRTLAHLDRLGHPIAGPERRICHWSSYTRHGILRFYNDLMRQPERLPLRVLRQGMPQDPDPRWSRLLVRPRVPAPLPYLPNAS
ncbi:MAG: alpha/beta hydrolase [Pseudomonadota bacterium]